MTFDWHNFTLLIPNVKVNVLQISTTVPIFVKFQKKHHYIISPSNRKSYIEFQFAYLHLTVAHCKGHDQSYLLLPSADISEAQACWISPFVRVYAAFSCYLKAKIFLNNKNVINQALTSSKLMLTFGQSLQFLQFYFFMISWHLLFHDIMNMHWIWIWIYCNISHIIQTTTTSNPKHKPTQSGFPNPKYMIVYWNFENESTVRSPICINSTYHH